MAGHPPIVQLLASAHSAHQAGRLAEAVRGYRRALKAAPDHPEALHLLGIALLQSGEAKEALAPLRRAARVSPRDAAIRLNLGNALALAGRGDEAIASYRQACDLGPDLADAWFNLGNALDQRGAHDDALAAYDRAVALDARQPGYRNNRGLCLKALGRLDDAEADFRAAVDVAPGFADAARNLGHLQLQRGRLAEAATVLSRALAVAPHRTDLAASLHWVKRELCDWDGLEALETRLVAAVRAHRGDSPTPVTPFGALTLPLTPLELRAVAGSHARLAERNAHRLCPDARPARPPRGARPERLRIGYASADFHDHATAHLVAGLFARHDRARFEIRLYSYGRADRSEWRQRLVAGSDEFVDLAGLGLCEAADRIRADRVDVLVDLKGFTRDGRPELLALRAAPVQVGYLGYPGTMGVSWYDGFVTDAVCSPPGSEAHFAERLVYLPGSYQANDREQAIADAAPSRAECGLPDEGFVYCCFNQTYKIEPALFDLWMRVLGRVPGSVLWLFRSHAEAEANLRREAGRRGVEPARLVFADRLPKAEHLARHRHADLFLDTLRVNAHTTASDALWAGVPVLTCPGETFQSRVAASLLHAAGLPELVMPDLAAYEEVAARLGQGGDELARLAERLQANRLTCSLFDTDGCARKLERAYDALWEACTSGARTAAIHVTA
jgi:predicted O-linked N-acetylglucosamine transferase (SPINDLY family)